MVNLKFFNQHEFHVEDKRYIVDISFDNSIDNFSIYIGKGKTLQETLQYISTLHITNKLGTIVTLLDAYAQAKSESVNDFDRTLRRFAVKVEVLHTLCNTLFDKILPKLNNDLRIYTYKKYKKLYMDKTYMMSILEEVTEILQEYFIYQKISQKELKEKLVPFYRSIYGLKELSENIYVALSKFKLPKYEVEMKNISMTMIDDYPFYGENLLFGRYATSVRNRHFNEEFETAINNHKSAISGVISRMNHNAKLLNTTAEKYFKKTFKTPIKDVFSIILLWSIEAIHVSESMARVLKSLNITKSNTNMAGQTKEKGYAAVEAYDGTLICEITIKNSKITKLGYYTGAIQNNKVLKSFLEDYVEHLQHPLEALRNIYLLVYALIPGANVSIRELKKPVKEKEIVVEDKEQKTMPKTAQ